MPALPRVTTLGTSAWLLASLRPLATAQGFTPGALVSDDVVGPLGVATGDLDSDGDLEILSASRSDEKIAWYENHSPGVFGTQNVLGTVRIASEVVAADVNADGLIDVVAGGEGDHVVVFLQTWPGSYATGLEVNAHTGFYLWDLEVTDLDADGHQDILTAGRQGVKWYRGDSTGAFLAPVTIDASYSYGVAVADLSGDGVLDLTWTEYISGNPSKLRVALATAPGQFATPIEVGASDDMRAVELGDADGDGDLDIFWADPSSSFGDVAWHENDGLGQFGPEIVLAGESFLVRLGDIDADGVLDVAARGVDWYRGLGGGAFGSAQSAPTPDGRDFWLADLDGDIDLDIVSAEWNQPDHRIRWYENRTHTGIGQRYCEPSVPNSTLRRGSIRADGNEIIFLNDVTLTASFLPQQSFDFFITSQSQGFSSNVPNSQGHLCLAGNVGRFVGPGQTQNTSAVGSFSVAVNLNAMPSPTGLVVVQPGETWNFQAWHRDANPNSTSNFTDAVSVTFQ